MPVELSMTVDEKPGTHVPGKTRWKIFGASLGRLAFPDGTTIADVWDECVPNGVLEITSDPFRGSLNQTNIIVLSPPGTSKRDRDAFLTALARKCHPA